MRPQPYYPLFADLLGRRCVVIGGGMVAQRKVTTLLGYGAQVTVISPVVTKRLAVYVRQGKIRHAARRFKRCDLDGAWLVYAATSDQATNELISRTAQRSRIFTNVVDQPSLCSFIAPAIFSRGPLTIAVSTGGASPSLAKHVRDELGRTVGAHYVPMLQLLADLRGVAKRTLPSYADRKRYFDRLVRGPVFALVRNGKRRQARREALSLLQRRTGKNGAGPR